MSQTHIIKYVHTCAHTKIKIEMERYLPKDVAELVLIYKTFCFIYK